MSFIRLHCPINPTGIGTHAQYLLEQLVGLQQTYGFVLSINPTGGVSYSVTPEARRIISGDLMTGKVNYFSSPPVDVVLNTPRRCVQWFNENEGKQSIKIAYIVFELYPQKNPPGADSRAQKYIDSLRALDVFDKIFVPAHNQKAILIGLGISEHKIEVVPEGVDPITAPRHPMNVNGDMVTYVNMGKFEHRKGHLELLRAMTRRALEGDRVRLVASWNNPWAVNIEHRLVCDHTWLQAKKTDQAILYSLKESEILLVNHMNWKHDVRKLWQTADAAIFPTKAEGWGLPIGDAAAGGIPTFATSNTAMADYLGEYNRKFPWQTFSAHKGYELARDGLFFEEDGLWTTYEPSLESQIVTCMRLFEETMYQADKRTELMRNAIKLSEDYSWRRAAEKFLSACGISLS